MQRARQGSSGSEYELVADCPRGPDRVKDGRRRMVAGYEEGSVNVEPDQVTLVGNWLSCSHLC